ncbi:hypothetical protein GBAR_LOCUS24691 [Geodia barretti]|uniref:Uncharacterized protein n=1 Tax=Geodia barretti TaxID=519541 RepID=A0AA35X3Z3_GEOBA|nr:hypothetical protein GBAR_LOCUS24691 [Geodia barretti]
MSAHHLPPESSPGSTLQSIQLSCYQSSYSVQLSERVPAPGTSPSVHVFPDASDSL